MRPIEKKVRILGEKWKKSAAEGIKRNLMKRGEIKEKEMRQRRSSLEGRRRGGRETDVAWTQRGGGAGGEGEKLGKREKRQKIKTTDHSEQGDRARSAFIQKSSQYTLRRISASWWEALGRSAAQDSHQDLSTTYLQHFNTSDRINQERSYKQRAKYRRAGGERTSPINPRDLLTASKQNIRGSHFSKYFKNLIT